MIYCFGHCFPYTDIDSLIGSLLLEQYFRNQGKEAEAVYFNENCLRQSTIEIFELSGLQMPRYVTKDELANDNIKFALVDHNDVMESFGQYGIDKEIEICIDHHTIQSNLKAREVRFKKIGAACSMIV